MAASVSYTDLYNDATKWASPDPAYVNDLVPLIGDAATVNRTEWVRNICNIAIRSPTVLAYVNHNDADYIYVAHAPSVYPADPSNATPFDNLLVMLQGSNSNVALPVCFPNTVGTRIVDTCCLRSANILVSLSAAPPVLMEGPHAAGTADTDLVSTRAMMLLPPSSAGEVLASLSVSGLRVM